MANPGSTSVVAAIALGSNLGDREAALNSALAALRRLEGVEVLAVSRFHETEPVGPALQGRFLNAAALLRTTLPPRHLLAAMLDIERAAGRERTEKWGPRTLDLDLLVYGEFRIDEPGLTVPHPRLAERAFVLEPLAEVAPAMDVPGAGTVAELLSALRTGRRRAPD